MAVKRATRRKERRSSTRVDARLSMRVEGAREGGAPAQIVTESQNISSSGIYCMSSHYLPPLSKVQLTIVLPRIPGTNGGQELIKCEGIVVRCESAQARRAEPQYQLACMFAEMDDRRRESIEEFVTWRNLQSLRAAVGAAPRRAKPAAKKPATRRAVTAPLRRATTARARRTTGARRSAR